MLVTAAPRRVVASVSLQDIERPALRWARQLADALHVPLVAVVPFTTASAEHSPQAAAEFAELTAAETTSWLAADDLAVDAVTSIDGEFTEQCSTLVNRDDVVVIGVEAPVGTTGLALGSAAHELAGRLPCPLVLVPSSVQMPSPDGDIVVGIEDTEGNARVVEWAHAFGDRVHHRVRGLHVDTTDPAKGLAAYAHDAQPFLTVAGVREDAALSGLVVGEVADHLMHDPPGPLAILTHEVIGAADGPDDGIEVTTAD